MATIAAAVADDDDEDEEEEGAEGAKLDEGEEAAQVFFSSFVETQCAGNSCTRRAFRVGRSVGRRFCTSVLVAGETLRRNVARLLTKIEDDFSVTLSPEIIIGVVATTDC